MPQPASAYHWAAARVLDAAVGSGGVGATCLSALGRSHFLLDAGEYMLGRFLHGVVETLRCKLSMRAPVCRPAYQVSS